MLDRMSNYRQKYFVRKDIALATATINILKAKSDVDENVLNDLNQHTYHKYDNKNENN